LVILFYSSLYYILLHHYSFFFFLNVRKDSRNNTGYRVSAIFQISLHSRYLALLEEIRIYFGGIGYIYNYSNRDVIIYYVTSITDLEVIITHFDKYPLITQKWSDYQLFKQAFKLIKQKEHLTIEGLNKIVGIKGSMNMNRLPEKLKIAFPDIIPVERPLVQNQIIPDPNWVAGFMTGEGSVYVRIKKSLTHQIGSQVELILQMTQHIRDEQLLISFLDYFGCGKYRQRKGGLSRKARDFFVNRFTDLSQKIIPFFDKYPIMGVKNKDLVDWCKVVELMKAQAHLTEEGLEQIRKIKDGMNSYRKG